MRRRRKRPILHRGLHYARTAHPASTLEKALADEWERENRRQPGTDYGYGLLQNLMIQQRSHPNPRPGPAWFESFDPISFRVWRRVFVVRRGTAAAVATAIQWLGSNCGRCFLETALARAGWSMIRTEHLDRLHEDARRGRTTERASR